MNFSEFEQTIKHALSFIDFTPQEGEIKECFGAVDIDQDGYISY
jgi:Ca2+-binding EF-hand superfamily protein